jgi:hypothetical protein
MKICPFFCNIFILFTYNQKNLSMSKLINEVIKVDGCANCPFRRFSYCGIEVLVFTNEQERSVNNDLTFRHPECPLKKGKIMVELKKE